MRAALLTPCKFWVLTCRAGESQVIGLVLGRADNEREQLDWLRA